MSILIMMEISAAGVAFIYKETAIVYIEEHFMDVTRSGALSDKNINHMQSSWYCCGKNGPTDWQHFIPKSCYKPPGTMTDDTKQHTDRRVETTSKLYTEVT